MQNTMGSWIITVSSELMEILEGDILRVSGSLVPLETGVKHIMCDVIWGKVILLDNRMQLGI